MRRDSAKQKGNAFELNIQASLLPIYPDIVLTKEVGFRKGYDLMTVDFSTAFEVKCHKSFSWNELVSLYHKLVRNSPKFNSHILVFKGNRQPPLVMYFNGKVIQVIPFEDYFHTRYLDSEERRKMTHGTTGHTPTG